MHLGIFLHANFFEVFVFIFNDSIFSKTETKHKERNKYFHVSYRLRHGVGLVIGCIKAGHSSRAV
jgi:hypothetical protein